MYAQLNCRGTQSTLFVFGTQFVLYLFLDSIFASPSIVRPPNIINEDVEGIFSVELVKKFFFFVPKFQLPFKLLCRMATFQLQKLNVMKLSDNEKNIIFSMISKKNSAKISNKNTKHSLKQ